jgi:hypothetical protein
MSGFSVEAIVERVRASHVVDAVAAEQVAAEQRDQGYDQIGVGRDLEKKLAELRLEFQAKLSHMAGQIEELSRSMERLEGKLQATERDKLYEPDSQGDTGGWL